MEWVKQDLIRYLLQQQSICGNKPARDVCLNSGEITLILEALTKGEEMTDDLKTQMTEAHALAATQESVEHKAAMLQEPNAETPVLVHEAFVQTEDMVQGTPVLM